MCLWMCCRQRIIFKSTTVHPYIDNPTIVLYILYIVLINHTRGEHMLTLECVSNKDLKIRTFCLTDCGPSEGCNPDDYYYPEEEANKED